MGSLRFARTTSKRDHNNALNSDPPRLRQTPNGERFAKVDPNHVLFLTDRSGSSRSASPDRDPSPRASPPKPRPRGLSGPRTPLNTHLAAMDRSDDRFFPANPPHGQRPGVSKDTPPDPPHFRTASSGPLSGRPTNRSPALAAGRPIRKQKKKRIGDGWAGFTPCQPSKLQKEWPPPLVPRIRQSNEREKRLAQLHSSLEWAGLRNGAQRPRERRKGRGSVARRCGAEEWAGPPGARSPWLARAQARAEGGCAGPFRLAAAEENRWREEAGGLPTPLLLSGRLARSPETTPGSIAIPGPRAAPVGSPAERLVEESAAA